MRITSTVVDMDVCRVCGVRKPITDFGRCKGRTNNEYYRRHVCKRCRGNELKTADAHLVQRNTKARNRRKALMLLGDRCTCCGETRPGMLTFDHVNGDGRRSGAYPRKVVAEIIKMDSPTSKYCILCHQNNDLLPVPSQGGRSVISDTIHTKAKYVRLSPTVLFTVPACYGSYDTVLRPVDVGVLSSWDKCVLCPVKQQCESNQETVER